MNKIIKIHLSCIIIFLSSMIIGYSEAKSTSNIEESVFFDFIEEADMAIWGNSDHTSLSLGTNDPLLGAVTKYYSFLEDGQFKETLHLHPNSGYNTFIHGNYGIVTIPNSSNRPRFDAEFGFQQFEISGDGVNFSLTGYDTSTGEFVNLSESHTKFYTGSLQ